MTVVRGGCPHDCPDTCAWEVRVEDGRAVELRGVKEHPITRGGLCAKVNHYLERVYSPDRIVHPLRRVGAKGAGEFERIGWDEALDEIAGRLGSIVAESGGQAVLPYSYMGTQGMVQGGSIDRRFFARLGATRLVREICGSTAAAGVAAAQGTGVGMTIEDVVHSRLIVLWGTNTIVTNLHLWPLIQEARGQGARVVVIDPLRTRTAQSADWHVRPMPGTDEALALGLMHVILAEGLHDADYVKRFAAGLDELRTLVAAYDPARVASITRIPAEEVVELARAYASTRPAAIRVLIGMEHHERGGATYRAIACLPVLTGAWRERGGGLLRTMAWAGMAPLDEDALRLPELEDPAIRSVNMVQLGRALTELEPPIKALVVYNSNPAAIAPNQTRVLEGLRRDDLFTVAIEQFLTDTARHADIVLPATTQVEHLDVVPSWGHAYVTLNRPAIEPIGECLPNSEIFRRLAKRMGFDEPIFDETDEQLVEKALASGHPWLEGVAEGLERDGYARVALPEDWRPFAEGGFGGPDGRVDLALPGYEPAVESPAGDPALAARFPLALLSSKSALHFLNSSYANLPRQLKAEKEPLLEIHPDDAAPRSVEDGAEVRVFNDRGEVRLRARVGDRVRPGVVSMPSGWWASLSPGGASVNVLTSDDLADLGGGGDFHDTLVEVASVPPAHAASKAGEA